MRIQYCSDLHLEFPENSEFLKQSPLQPKGDILVLAGDIVPFVVMNKHKDFFDYVADNFEQTYWVPGNHEYYSFDLSLRNGAFNESIRSNVHLVNNVVAEHGSIKFIFTTLWSQIRPENRWQIQGGMSDFQVIKFDGEPFSVDHFNLLHNECLSFLKLEIGTTDSCRKVVVTHHAPTFLNYPVRFKGDSLNDAFAVELHHIIEPSNIDCWIYGHTHANTPTFEIGGTKMLTNQLGYVSYSEHGDFKNDKFITLNSFENKDANIIFA